MDTTIRNLDDHAYRRLKAHAALTGKTVGQAVNEAIQAYLARRWPLSGQGSLADWHPVEFPEGSERLSEEIDLIVYRA